MTQGYVGVTRKGEQQRFKQHLKSARLGRKGRFQSALRKYGEDGVVLSVLVIGLENYCYDVEEKIRPTTHIGWNYQRGGMTTDRQFLNDTERRNSWVEKLRLANIGKKLPEEVCFKMSETNKEKWKSNENFKARMREISLSNRLPHTPVDRFWKRSQASFLIAEADLLYKAFIENPDMYTHELLNIINPEYKDILHKRSAVKLIQKFLGGWNPFEDLWWQYDFKGLPESEIPNYLRFPDSWNTSRCPVAVWSQADKIYDLVKSGAQPAGIASALNLGKNSIKVLYKRMKNDWNPKEDPRWLSWVESLKFKEASWHIH